MSPLLIELYTYFANCVFEEWLFRWLPLYFMPNGWGVLLTAVIYGLAHLIWFRWQMAAVCAPFGLLLGWLYLLLKPITDPLAFFAVILLHFAGGVALWKSGIGERWLK